MPPSDEVALRGMEAVEVRPRLPWGAAAAIAARQHGRITGAQLRSVGLSQDAITHAIRTGRLHPEHRGVYALGHPGADQEARWMSAVLACGAASVLSHRAAAAHLGLTRERTAPAEVTVPRPSSARRNGIVVHHATSLAPHDRALRWRIPVTNEPRTLVDLAAVAGRRTLETAFDLAARRRRLDVAAIHEVLSRVARPRGARALRSILADHDACPWTRSELERRFVRLCRRHGLAAPLVNVPLEAGGLTLLADFVWLDRRLVVETDGMEFHGTAPAARWDRRRDRALVLAGWRVLRYTWIDIAERAEATVAELEVALGGPPVLQVRRRRAG